VDAGRAAELLDPLGARAAGGDDVLADAERVEPPGQRARVRLHPAHGIQARARALQASVGRLEDRAQAQDVHGA
jgi:hypothetical protein